MELKFVIPVSFPYFCRLTLFFQDEFTYVTKPALEPLVYLGSGLLFFLSSQETSTRKQQEMGEGWGKGFNVVGT